MPRRTLLAALRRIAAAPLWGESILLGSLRDDCVSSGEYDTGAGEFNPSARHREHAIA